MLGILKCRLCGEYPTLKTCQEPAGRFSATIEHKCIRGNSSYIHYGFGESAEDAENHVIIFWNDDHGVRDPAWYAEKSDYLEDRFGGPESVHLLKPCPFCGSSDLRFRLWFSDDTELMGAYIICDKCLAMFDQAEACSRSDLIEAWNRRA